MYNNQAATDFIAEISRTLEDFSDFITFESQEAICREVIQATNKAIKQRESREASRKARKATKKRKTSAVQPIAV